MQRVPGDTDFDIVVWGATGFTGRLVVEYLSAHYGRDTALRWAIAGRDRDKLDALRKTQTNIDNQAQIIVADSHDSDSLDRLTKATRVVLSTVGPYAKYGSELVASCVRTGTDYCDLCGETQWLRKMIDEHQIAAIASGARIVMCCGFDSIPSDFGVWHLQRQALQRHGKLCTRITMLVRAMRGGASGGTFASMLNAIDEAKSDRQIARTLADPYALDPENGLRGSDGRDQTGVGYFADAKVWTAPFVMAAVNTRVVRRSNALQEYAYGKDFRYAEASIAGKGLSGYLRAFGISIGLKLFFLAGAIPVLRRAILQRMLPKPGDGPPREARNSGFFNLLMIGHLPDASILRLRITGDRDPGYGSTSKMIAETAVCLACDNIDSAGGFWTPVTGLGEPLFRRLTQNAGLTFNVE